MQLPYTQLELQIAAISAGRKLEAFETTHGEGSIERTMGDIMKKYQQDPHTDNAGAAAFHGITIDQLVNSQNYQVLKQEFATSVVKRIIEEIKKGLGLEDIEAWALMLQA